MVCNQIQFNFTSMYAMKTYNFNVIQYTLFAPSSVQKENDFNYNHSFIQFYITRL